MLGVLTKILFSTTTIYHDSDYNLQCDQLIRSAGIHKLSLEITDYSPDGNGKAETLNIRVNKHKHIFHKKHLVNRVHIDSGPPAKDYTDT